MLAKTAGLDNVSILAPVDMKHPNEYDFKSNDIKKVNDAAMVIYSEYEPFMKQIFESADVPKEDRCMVVTENTLETLRTLISSLTEKMGTTDKTLTQAAELATLKPALIIYNFHFPQGTEIASLANVSVVELRNYPETEEQALVQLIQDNAKKLGLKLPN
ncbi:hypothetical protein C1I60_02700 [Paenibacillus terrae]|uniref:Uncharacterized protein n=1 Tax=Paenibacillus terrae TaxID=159743 RepID=A0A4U2Q2R7_9BACL|nr:zinc ABC transporter substrate-binding protein [Paenibacillus terrae]TKH46513.1 hypothetical protein C1I60_02700 [Paenibacillus terrae]